MIFPFNLLCLYTVTVSSMAISVLREYGSQRFIRSAPWLAQVLTYMCSEDKRETHLLASKDNIWLFQVPLLKEWPPLCYSYISNTWAWSFCGTVHAFKMLNALEFCWSQWELKCTLLFSVIKILPKGGPNWCSESLLRNRHRQVLKFRQMNILTQITLKWLQLLILIFKVCFLL